MLKYKTLFPLLNPHGLSWTLLDSKQHLSSLRYYTLQEQGHCQSSEQSQSIWASQISWVAVPEGFPAMSLPTDSSTRFKEDDIMIELAKESDLEAIVRRLDSYTDTP